MKILVRETITAKPGNASKLAKMFKKMTANDKNARVMTDLAGNYNTVIMETTTESLAAWEKQMEEYKSGKPDPNMTPELEKEMAHYTEMYQTGKREFFQIWE